MGNVAMAARVQEQAGWRPSFHVCGGTETSSARSRTCSGSRARCSQHRHHHGRSAEDGRFPRRLAVYDLDSIGILCARVAPQPRHRSERQAPRRATRFVLCDGRRARRAQLRARARAARPKKKAGAEIDDPAGLRSGGARALPRGHRPARPARCSSGSAARELPQRRVPPQRGPRHGARGRPRAHAQGGSDRAHVARASPSRARCLRPRMLARRGAYIMPPLERYYELALEVVDGFSTPSRSCTDGHAIPPSRLLHVAACGLVRQGERSANPAPSASASPSAAVVAEPSRAAVRARKDCRSRARTSSLATSIGRGLLAGIVRMNGGKRVASVVKTSLMLAEPSFEDIGPAIGDDLRRRRGGTGRRPGVLRGSRRRRRREAARASSS